MANKQTTHDGAVALGFEELNGVFFGTWQGYAVSQFMNQGFYSFQFAVRTDKKDAQLRKTLLADMKARCAKRCRGVILQGSSVLFNMMFDRKQPYSEQMKAFLDAMAAALRSAGVAPAQTCAHCGGHSPDSLCLVGTSNQPVHAACVRSAREAVVEKAQSNQESGSYLAGFIGAVLGTIIGLIPNVLTMLYAERIYALLFALVPLAAMFGYRLFKGRKDKAAIVIIVLLSVLAVFVQQTIYVVIELTKEYGVTFAEAFDATREFLFTSEGVSAMMQDCAMQFVFMALGIVIAWRYLAQTNTGAVAHAEAAASTLRPIRSDSVRQP